MKKVIGIDIGGTKIDGIVFDGRKIVKELTIVTPKSLFEFERNLLKLVDFLSAQRKISGIGVGMAGLVDAKKGIVKYSPNIKFVKSLNLIKLFRAEGYKKAAIDNDANCFTRAEMLLGQGKKLNNFLALTLGTGIGGGIVINRQLYRGQNNMGGELGFTVVNKAFLEDVYKKARNSKNDAVLGKLIGQAFGQLVNIFAPEAIILGGGVSTDKRRHFLQRAIKEMRKYLFNQNAKPKILVSKLKNAGAIGAALLVK